MFRAADLNRTIAGAMPRIKWRLWPGFKSLWPEGIAVSRRTNDPRRGGAVVYLRRDKKSACLLRSRLLEEGGVLDGVGVRGRVG